MKIMKAFGSIIGFAVILLNMTSLMSCKQKECCTWTYGGTSFTYCEGDSVTDSYGSTYELTGTSWAQMKIATYLMGGTCS